MKTYPVYLKGELKITDTSYEVINPASGEVFARMHRLQFDESEPLSISPEELHFES